MNILNLIENHSNFSPIETRKTLEFLSQSFLKDAEVMYYEKEGTDKFEVCVMDSNGDTYKLEFVSKNTAFGWMMTLEGKMYLFKLNKYPYAEVEELIYNNCAY